LQTAGYYEATIRKLSIYHGLVENVLTERLDVVDPNCGTPNTDIFSFLSGELFWNPARRSPKRGFTGFHSILISFHQKHSL
jgi:hypothetical protein